MNRFAQTLNGNILSMNIFQFTFNGVYCNPSLNNCIVVRNNLLRINCILLIIQSKPITSLFGKRKKSDKLQF